MKNAKFRLASEASQINVNNEFLFIKYQNRLFRINAGAKDKRLKILDLLKETRKLTEVLDSLSDFRKRDIVDFLRKLDSLQLLDFQVDDKNLTISRHTKLGKSTGHRITGEKIGKLFSSQVLLVGNGILAKKIHHNLRDNGISSTKVTSSTIFNRKIWERRKSDHNSKSLSHNLASNDYRLIIAAEDFPNIRLFEIINKFCFKRNIPWLRASFDDNIGYLGPFVIPRKTSCYNCFQLRIVTNSWHYEYQLWRYKEFIPETKVNAPRLSVDVLAALCSNEIIMYLKYKKPKTLDSLYVFDTTKMEVSRHKVIFHPACMYCRLTQVPRYSMLDSKGNTCLGEEVIAEPTSSNSGLSDQELLDRLREIEDEKTGIVTKTQKYYEPNIFGVNFHHFYGAIGGYPLRNQMLKQNTSMPEGNMMSPPPSGSGISPAEAKLHALMEMVERYSSMVIDESRITWTTYNKVRNRAINPLEFTLYEDRLYRKKDFRCSRFSPNSTLPWLEGQDLFSGKRKLLCADFVYYPAIREKPLVMETSNGAASHTNLVQAILNGLYEAIERDAFLIMWLKRLSMPIIDLKDLPFSFSESIRMINKYGMMVKLVDLTNDTNVPTVMAVCYNKSDKYPGLIVGAGTHIDPKKAIQKALLETELLLFHYVENPTEKRITGMNKIQHSYEHAMYYLSPGRRKHWDFMIKSREKSNIYELKQTVRSNYGILMGIVKRLQASGHRVIWVDITPPDIQRLGIKVVKVYVTGFQQLYFGNENRLNLERLSKVPVRHGYSKKKEIDLINTEPHPLS